MSGFAYMDHLLRNREEAIGGLTQKIKDIVVCLTIFLSLSIFYGLIMGAGNLIHGQREGWKFALAAAVKLPMLFLITLAICLPLLYVLNVMIGPRAQFKAILGLLMSSIAVTSILLGACAPIVLFFMLSTTSYPFMKLLNVLVFALAGGYGVWFLGKGLFQISPKKEAPPPVSTSGTVQPQWITENSVVAEGVRTVMTYWLITYGIVGTQLAWLLRPFIGNPNSPFSFFRHQESNFYVAVAEALGKLLSGH